MSKDPAFLFYPGDWLGGTMGMTLEQKGAYLELLIFQFNNGPFTLAQAEHVLGTCKAHAKHMLLQKFTHKDDRFYNVRLAEEIEKRKRYSESRKINAKTKKKDRESNSTCLAHAEHMENENDNTNNVFGIKNLKEWQISIKKVYLHDRIKIIYDLREWFKHADQLAGLERAGLTRFDEFMEANPAAIFDDDRHLYNAFRKYCQEAPKKAYTVEDFFPD